MIETLVLSEPVAPPWHHDPRALVRNLVRHCPDVQHHVLTTADAQLELDHVTEERFYSEREAVDGTAASISQNARMLLRLLRPDQQRLYHLFMPLDSPATRMARRVLSMKQRATVQTVVQTPQSFDDIEKLLFADRVVALSEHTKQRLEAAGVDGVIHVPPGITPPVAYDSTQRLLHRAEFGFAADRAAVVFPGHYGPDRAAFLFAAAIEQLAPAIDLTFAFACHVRNEAERAVEQQLKARLSHLVERRRVRFIGDLQRRDALLAAADLVVYPNTSTAGQLDVPLVLLDSLAARTPILISDLAPQNEVLGTATRAPRAPVGHAVPPRDPDALAAAIAEMVCDKPRLDAMGHSGRIWVDARYHARSMGAAHALLYLSLE